MPSYHDEQQVIWVKTNCAKNGSGLLQQATSGFSKFKHTKKDLFKYFTKNLQLVKNGICANNV